MRAWLCGCICVCVSAEGAVTERQCVFASSAPDETTRPGLALAGSKVWGVWRGGKGARDSFEGIGRRRGFQRWLLRRPLVIHQKRLGTRPGGYKPVGGLLRADRVLDLGCCLGLPTNGPVVPGDFSCGGTYCEILWHK